MIFELMSISLYDLLKINNFEQMKMDFIRRFAIQIFSALVYLKDLSVIHSDIKPENVLLKSRTKTGIKLIDFGTSILESDEHYTYVQSRYYRAPEVILGHSYSFPIDMWSAGCLLA
jgi:serine/threonine protein kinase